MGSYDSIISKAIGGLHVDGEVYELRAQHEAVLSAAQEALFEKKHNADELARAVRAAGIPVHGEYTGFDSNVTAMRGAFEDHAALIERLACETEAYRMRHGLTCEPEQVSPVEGAMSIGFVTALESIINSGFFLSAHLSAGPVDAILASTLISLTNMSVSVAGGYFAGRGWNFGAHAPDHNNEEFERVRKTSRLWSFASWVALGFLQISVGCVRAQETFDIQHSPSAYLDVFATPESLFLVLIGLVMSVFGWHKGRTALDDPYPGYGERSRARKNAQDAIHEEYAQQVDEVEMVEDEALGALSEAHAEIEEKVAACNKAVHEYMHEERAIRRAIQNASSNMAAGIAQISNTHQMGSKRKSKGREISPGALSVLTDFSAYLPGDPPAYFDAPDFTGAQSAIGEAKSRAVKTLSEAFDNARKAARGE